MRRVAVVTALCAAAGCLEAGEQDAPAELPTICGDGRYEPGREACDGSAPASPPCRQDCTIDGCGDDVLVEGEACEPALAPPGLCTARCEWSRCGDGVLDEGEVCDEGPGNGEASPSCTQSCTIPACGDGIVSPRLGEQCEGDVDCAACRLTRCAITHVAASRDVLFVVRNDGALFVTGSVTEAGLAPWLSGLDGGTATTPRQLVGAPAFVQLVSRHGAGAGLTADGRLFTFGGSTFGQRGDGTVAAAPTEPFTDPMPERRFRDVAATERGALALATDGEVWAFGDDDTGELGPSAAERQSCPFDGAAVPCRPTAVRTLVGLDGIVRLYAGEASLFVDEAAPWRAATASIALDRVGRAWGFGSDAWGQLGHDNDVTVACPNGATRCWLTPTSMLEEPVIDVALNEKAALLLRRDGVVVGFGGKDALGLSSNAIEWDWRAAILPMPNGIWLGSLSGASNFFAARTHGGRVVGLGFNETDRFAIGGGRQVLAAGLVTAPEGAPVVEVATAFWNTIVRLEDGRAYAWGRGVDGRLGDGVREEHSATEPIELHVCP